MSLIPFLYPIPPHTQIMSHLITPPSTHVDHPSTPKPNTQAPSDSDATTTLELEDFEDK